MKPSAAGGTLLKYRGLAVVFGSIEDLRVRIDDPALEVDENSILVQGLRAEGLCRHA